MNFKGDASLFYRFSRWCTLMFYRIFYRFEAYGVDEHWCDGPAIIAANHTSFYDPPAVGIAVKKGIHYLARKSLFRFPIFGFMLKRYHVHPLDEGSATSAIKAVTTLLSQNKQVVIFPEGTRQKDDKIGKVKAGIGMLVQRTQCPIIPVYILGAYQVWNRHRRLPKLYGKIICVVGSPIKWENFAQMDRKKAQKAVVEKWKESLAALKNWYENDAKGSPP